MAEYVTKLDVIAIITGYARGCVDTDKTFDIVDDTLTLCDEIENLPAADVVPVIRCKDCVHCVKRKFDNVTEYECGVFDIFVDLQDYCCKGERKAK